MERDMNGIFQNLVRSRTVRHLNLKQGGVVWGRYRVIIQFQNKEFPIDFSSATSNPQQVQISLDHDYCSSSSKMKRGQRLANNTSHALNHYQQNSNGSPIGSGNNIISTTRPVIRLHQSSNSHSVNQLNCQLQNGGTVSCSASPNTGLVLSKKD